MDDKVLGGRYEILEKIGEGGMSVVFKARCRLLKRFVAVKILKPQFTKDEKFILNFRKESQAAASLSHQNIVNVYDVGIEEKKIHYIVMEYIEGETLSDLIKNEGPLSISRAIDIASQIALGLSHAHKNHIIHRDIKPHNILITKEGIAKVTDFGIAQAVTQSTIVSNNNEVMGSVHYFSPEQARGGYVDEKSDLYSLGIVLYEMVTGEVPFEGDTLVSIAMKHMNESIPKPSLKNDKITEALENVILKATEKIQVKRYMTALDFYDALQNLSLGKSVIKQNSHIKETKVVMPPDYKDKLDETYVREERKAKTHNKNDKLEKKLGKKFSMKQKILNSKKITKISAIGMAILLAFIASSLIMALKPVFFVQEVVVPDLVSISYMDGLEKLNELGLAAERVEEYNTEVEEEQIIAQNPVSGTKIKEGQIVEITVSKGEKLIPVPSLLNKKLEDAIFLLERHNLHEGIISNESSELPVGVVIRQSPAPGKEISVDTEVNIVVSEGVKIKTILMIDLIGKDLKAAQADIEGAGLKVGDIEYIVSTTEKNNSVVGQSIEAGKETQENAAIDLKVIQRVEDTESENEDNTDDDDSSTDENTIYNVPITLNYDQATNDTFSIKVFKIQSGKVEIIYNQVHNKANSGKEQIVISGAGKAQISIYFDDVQIAEKNINFETGEFYD